MCDIALLRIWPAKLVNLKVIAPLLQVVVDANNPLAGLAVDIDIEVLEATPADKFSRATFAMGCFWGPELLFQRIPGVLATRHACFPCFACFPVFLTVFPILLPLPFTTPAS